MALSVALNTAPAAAPYELMSATLLSKQPVKLPEKPIKENREWDSTFAYLEQLWSSLRVGACTVILIYPCPWRLSCAAIPPGDALHCQAAAVPGGSGLHLQGQKAGSSDRLAIIMLRGSKGHA